MVLGNKNFFDKLPEDLRQIVLDAARAFVMEHRRIMPASEMENMKLLQEKGMEINELTPEEKHAFVEATAPTYDEFESVLSKEIMDLARKAQK